MNLEALFNSNRKSIDNHYNCIYKITNIINSHSYIGRAQDLYRRFVSGSTSHYNTYIYIKSNNIKRIYLYNALIKYNISNFEVSIIEESINTDELNNHEIYWISYYNTFNGPGYNMTPGGESAENMRLRNLELWPETNGANPNWLKAGMNNLIKYHELPYELRLPSIIKRKNTIKERFPECDGHPIFWTQAGLAKMKELYPDTNGVPPGMAEKGTELHSVNSIFRYINKNIEYLNSINKPLIPKEYINICKPSHIKLHIKRVLLRYDKLVNDPRWNEIMDNIFNGFYISDNGEVMLK